MNPRRFFIGRAIGLVVLVLIIGLVALFYNPSKTVGPVDNTPGQATTTERYKTTLTGESLCLPHRDISGPQTMECAFGLKTDSGDYYAVDLNLMAEQFPDFPVGKLVTAEGTVTPIEMLSTDYWQRYPIKGILSVTDYMVVEK